MSDVKDNVVDLQNNKKVNQSTNDNKSKSKIVGLDLGTGNLCAAVMEKGDSNAEIRSMRNLFVDADSDADLTDIDHIKSEDGKYYIFGEHALTLANIFGKTCRRPMSQGVISTSDIDALDVIAMMIENLIGRGDGNICCYSIPSPPTDSQLNILYHVKVFDRILSDIGYKPISLTQAQAVCYSQCSKDGFSSIISDFGCGMSNNSLIYKNNAALQFSTTRGGDWIDIQSANSLGISAVGRITTIKERSLDLLNPRQGSKKEKRIKEAISFYYKDLITYTLDNIASKFNEISEQVEIPEELPWIISGGTSKVEGFLEFVRDVFENYDDFPIEIKEIRHATDPLTAVAEGCLIKALSEVVSSN